jgi:lipoprotein-releasing system ATP-binding protein
MSEILSAPSRMPVLRLAAVGRHFTQGKNRLNVLNGADLDLFPGQTVALVAPSGAGKSTLLHLAGLLERPDEGEVFVSGRAAGTLSDRDRTALRRTQLGFVYQFHHLLPEFSALENVIMPQLIAGASKSAAAARAKELLGRLRLDHRLDHRPAELSGGEQQRVAIARAIANRPLLLLADEPTGNLDPGTAALVQEEFMRLIHEEGLGALIATHNVELAKRMTRTFVLSNGKLVKR